LEWIAAVLENVAADDDLGWGRLVVVVDKSDPPR